MPLITDEQVIEARDMFRAGNQALIEDLVRQLVPFGLRVASKTTGRFICDSDEEAAIVHTALLEAIEKYEIDKGTFTVYLGRVIHHRIIDYKRREKSGRFAFIADLGERIGITPVTDNSFQEILEDIDRKQQVMALVQTMNEYNISLSDLVKSNPRQFAAREKAKEAGCYIASNSELREYFIKNKSLPIKSLEEKLRYNRKFLERNRKFIVAITLILIGDYPMLREYAMPWMRRVGKDGDN
ncbi:MAG: sigma factor [Deltaproteobacteria bacterium]